MARKKPTRKKPNLPPLNEEPNSAEQGALLGGAAYLITDSEGRFWDGMGWCADRREACLFSSAPDPYAKCLDAAALLRRLGWKCVIAYAPPSNERARAEIAVPELPDSEPIREPGRKNRRSPNGPVQ